MIALHTQETQKSQLLERLQQWFKVRGRPELWTKLCTKHGINFLATAVFSLDQSIVVVAEETLLSPLFQLGFKLAECRAARLLCRKPSILESFDSLRPNTEATLQDFCRNFRTERLPALLQLHSRIGGMCRSYMFQDPFVSQDSLVNWLTSPQSSRLYASFRAALHHAHVQSTPNSRALNILDALLLIDLALWWRGDDGMEDF